MSDNDNTCEAGRAGPAGPVVRLAKLSLVQQSHGSRFAAAMAAVAAPAGARRLGARLVEVPPGKSAWPYHCHHANDEIFVILEGEGRLRLGGENHPLAAGDVAVCPAGGPETAHQITNTGNHPLRYLAVSTMIEPEVMEYPDSDKVTVFAGAAPGGEAGKRRLSLTLPRGAAVDYWQGEGGVDDERRP